MTHITEHITKRIALVLALVAILAYAFLVNGATDGSTFATYSNTGKALELKIDAKSFYNGVLQPELTWNLKNLVPGVDKFWNFGDIKPDDYGTSSISIHIKDQGPAFVCLDFYNYTNLENGINEPESHVDTSSTTGELGDILEFFAWLDDGDKKFEVGELPLFGTTTQKSSILLNNTSYAIADALHGTPIPKGVTKYVGVYWCAGDLEVNVETGVATCDGEDLDNESQTDSVTVDVGIRAVVASAQPKFTCDGVPPPVNHCEIEGHKYNEKAEPLAGWTIGLSKKIRHSKGYDMYDLATTTTDKDGYFCLDWNGESRTLRGKSTYAGGAYTHEYFVYEYLKDGWKNVLIEKGATVPELANVPQNQIWTDGKYINVSMGTGYIISGAAYHVDFYNTPKTNKSNSCTPHDHKKDKKENTYDSWRKVETTSYLDGLKKKFKRS